jgi:D-lactate dehydrogenase (cytochrome)
MQHFYSLVQDVEGHLVSKGLYDKENPSAGPIKHIAGFGHIGDGNIHLNVMTTGKTKELESIITEFTYSQTERYSGSISAEHGIGLLKANYLHRSKSTDVISIMRQFKELFDPKGVLNPYKFFPEHVE